MQVYSNFEYCPWLMNWKITFVEEMQENIIRSLFEK